METTNANVLLSTNTWIISFQLNEASDSYHQEIKRSTAVNKTKWMFLDLSMRYKHFFSDEY